MAGKIRIVTDSSAQFLDPTIIQRHGITVVPLVLRLGVDSFREGVDIRNEAFLDRVSKNRNLTPVVTAPGVDQFTDIYTRLGHETDRILSIHMTRTMLPVWQNAKTAADSLLGRCEIVALDSQTTSVGLALLVEAAATLSTETDSLDDVVRAVRKLIPRIYAIFCVETLDYLRRGGLLSESQAILGAMLGIKPFLTIEEGDLIAMEKVRTRGQIIDKFVEFVTEFASVDNLVILQNSIHPTDLTRQLQERLIQEFSARSFPVSIYSPSLCTFIGPDAMGVIILEGDEPDDFDGDNHDNHEGQSNDPAR